MVSAARIEALCVADLPAPSGDTMTRASGDNPTMAEVEPGHVVTCAHVEEAGGRDRALSQHAA